MTVKTETIVGVALEHEGVLHSLPSPARHHDIIQILYKVYEDTIIPETEGFMTSTGRYVLREEALLIAKNANQLLPSHEHPTELFSESVW